MKIDKFSILILDKYKIREDVVFVGIGEGYQGLEDQKKDREVFRGNWGEGQFN